MLCLPVFMYTACMPGVSGDQKRALDSWKLELQMVVSPRISTGN